MCCGAGPLPSNGAYVWCAYSSDKKITAEDVRQASGTMQPRSVPVATICSTWRCKSASTGRSEQEKVKQLHVNSTKHCATVGSVGEAAHGERNARVTKRRIDGQHGLGRCQGPMRKPASVSVVLVSVVLVSVVCCNVVSCLWSLVRCIWSLVSCFH